MITFILEKTGQAYRSVSWEHPNLLPFTYKYLLYSYLDPLSPESCVQATSLDWTPMPQLTEHGDQGPSWGQESVTI